MSALGCGSGIHDILSPILPPPAQIPPTPIQMGNVFISPENAAVGPAQSQKFTATITGGVGGTIQWQVNGIAGGNVNVGTVDANGNYTAPSSVPQSMNVLVTAALASAPTTNFASATMAVIQLGVVTATSNPQVASYAMYLPAPGKVAVRFGKDASYGLNTSSQATTSANGGTVVNLVAGMLGTTLYHMRADVTLDNGATMSDIDQTFTTGIPPTTPSVQVTTASGQLPQPGIEIFDTAQFSTASYNPNLSEVFATDLQGNVIWTYQFAYNRENIVFSVKPLVNGHFLLTLGLNPSPPSVPVPSGAVNSLREIDLVGNTVRELTMDTLNQALVAKGFTGLNLIAFSHDVLALPNGHFVALATTSKTFPSLKGYSGPIDVSGDALVDLDQNFSPDWVWNIFDHLDINRHPFNFPPFWTISNALAYSSDDGNLLLSVRDQSWVLKIDFANAQGTGNILWKLGNGGDFKLMRNGAADTNPADWFYAQHGLSFFSPNTTGVFKLGLMDNGDNRAFTPCVGQGLANPNNEPICYSTAPVFQIDETAKTATILSRYVAPTALYNYFGGQEQWLANGDAEADFCSSLGGATVQEFIVPSGTTSTPQMVWQATTPGYDQYRATRRPSLYPGIQW